MSPDLVTPTEYAIVWNKRSVGGPAPPAFIGHATITWRAQPANQAIQLQTRLWRRGGVSPAGAIDGMGSGGQGSGTAWDEA